MGQPHFIVFANEKGGTGKSTTAVHTAIALAASGHRVGALDLDQRQRTMTRYLENRDATMRRLGKDLPVAADQRRRAVGLDQLDRPDQARRVEHPTHEQLVTKQRDDVTRVGLPRERLDEHLAAIANAPSPVHRAERRRMNPFVQLVLADSHPYRRASW